MAWVPSRFLSLLLLMLRLVGILPLNQLVAQLLILLVQVFDLKFTLSLSSPITLDYFCPDRWQQERRRREQPWSPVR